MGGGVSAVPDQGFAVLRQRVLRLTGLDLNAYKGAQLQRRLQSFLRRHGMPDYAVLGWRLERDPRLLEEFRDFLTINVSEFFRNPDRYRELQERILPRLLAERPSLRIWSAGCSIGAEPYTVALILEELTPGRQHYILATDVDRMSLARAAEAVYQEAELRCVPEHMRRRFFRRVDKGWQLDGRIARRVEFRWHNLLEDPMPRDMDLILCRNVVIYFTDEAKESLYRRFHESLRPGGFLFTGGTETIFNAQTLGFRLVSPCFYEKAASGDRGGH